jgi:NitT/TauT family transport system ATP-binding protein
LFVGNRVVILSPSPGRVSSLLDVPIGQPRTLEVKRSANFQVLRGELAARLEAAGVPVV